MAKEHNVRITTVYRRVAEERQRRKRYAQEAQAASLGHKLEPISMLKKKSDPGASLALTEASVEALATSPILTREERLQALSGLARTAPDAVRVAAIAKLEEFERAAGSQFGPPPPTTDEDVVRYLCELFEGMSRLLIDEAINRVFNPPAQESPEISEPQASDDLVERRTDGL